MSNPMTHPEAIRHWNNLGTSIQQNLEKLVYAEDTSPGRSAAYLVVIYTDPSNKMVYGKVAYGKIGTKLTYHDVFTTSYASYNTADAHVSIANTKVMDKLQAKLRKNYRGQDSYTRGTGNPRAKPKETNLPLTSVLPMNIGSSNKDFPDYIEVEDINDRHRDLIESESFVFERIPQRMRMGYIIFVQQGIGIYTISGQLTGAHEYDGSKHNHFNDFVDIIKDGVIFTGHVDGNGRIVIQHYKGHLFSKVARPDLTWAQQKTITTLILNTLYNDKEDIYDRNLPVYCADYVVEKRDKLIMIDNKGHGYATNVAYYHPHQTIEAINYLER